MKMNIMKFSGAVLLHSFSINCISQKAYLPQGMADHEHELMEEYLESRAQLKGVTTPPPFSSL